MLVREIMHKGTHLVNRDISVKLAVKMMTNLNIGAVLVGTPESMEGIFSERDLMLRVVVPGLSIENTPINEVMTKKVLTVDETERVDKVLIKMEKLRIRHLPVVSKNGNCVGMLGIRDLMGAMLEKLENENKIMVEYLLAVSRVAIAIVDLAGEIGIKEDGTIVIKHKLSKSKFEDITDTSKKTLNKILENFQNEGLISVSRNKIVILDNKKLKQKII